METLLIFPFDSDKTACASSLFSLQEKSEKVIKNRIDNCLIEKRGLSVNL